ncbi:putative ribonuclease H-like domain-containing protein, partial [Tanacetum coccineum]
IEAIRLFLAYASFKDFMVHQMDFKSAFLYGKIEKEVYVCQPPGYENPDFPGRVYKVEKALYGLHQAPKAWSYKEEGIGVNAGDSKLMLIGINLLLLEKVNAARHNLLLLVVTLVDGKKVIITETCVRRDLRLEDGKGIECVPNAHIFEQLALMGYEKPSQKLTFYKAFFSPQWMFLIHTILQCLSAKSTAWNEFSSTMASAIICLATNHKFNFSKYIFKSMVKNVDSSVKFLIYLRVGKGFSEAVTPLFPTMIVQAQEEIEPIADEVANEENVPTQSNDPPLSRVNILGSGEDKLKLKELMDLCTKLSDRVVDLETTKTAQAKEIASLKKRVKKLERKRKSKTLDMKRLFKIGRSAQVVSYEDEGLDVFNGKEVFVAEQSEKVVEEVVSIAEVSVAATITTEEITLAQALAELRSVKPKIVVQEPMQSTTTTAPSTIPKAKSKRHFLWSTLSVSTFFEIPH